MAEQAAEEARLEEENRIKEENRINRIRIPMASDWYITSEWGNRCDVYNVYNGCLHHSGLDFGNGPTWGQAFYPVAKGTVTAVYYGGAGPWPGCGNYVAVYHEALDLTSMSCHMDEIWVSVGQYLDPDVALGTVGTSGMSNGIHLHLTIYPGNQISSGDVNPRDFFINHGLM